MVSLFLAVVQEAPIGHVGHHHIGSRTCIQAHTNQVEDIGVIKVLHFDAFLHDFIYLAVVEETWVECQLHTTGAAV